MITRRQALAGMSAVGIVSLAGPVFAQAPRLFFYQLYSEGVTLSETALALNGSVVEMTGYMAPPLKAESPFFVFTDIPMETCPFCDDIALWPDNIIFVTADRPFPTVRFNRQIRVRGTLDLGEKLDPETGFVSLVRLENAELART